MVAADLDLLGSGDAAQARLLAGQLAGALGRPAEADAHLRAAARNRYRRVTALARAQGWLAEAFRADAAGDRRRLLAACGRGLAILDEHQVTLGAWNCGHRPPRTGPNSRHSRSGPPWVPAAPG